jgi:hypothetical protein
MSFQPGATPQDLCQIKIPSAESAIHFTALGRAFSARDDLDQRPGAVPQAIDEVAPLALKTYQGEKALFLRMDLGGAVPSPIGRRLG